MTRPTDTQPPLLQSKDHAQRKAHKSKKHSKSSKERQELRAAQQRGEAHRAIDRNRSGQSSQCTP